MSDKKYYWLKLKRDFFKRHDIRVLETRCGGEKLVLVYLKMLCESVDHNGELRFSDAVPYNADTLSAVLNETVDTLEMALPIFEEYGLIEVLDDKTIYMPKVEDMIGSASNNDNAIRQQRYRDRLKSLENEDSVTKNNEDVTVCVTNDNESKSKSKIKSKSKNNIFSPPSVEEVREYCIERGNNIDPESFVAFYESKGWMIGKNKMKNWKMAVITWEKSSKPKNSRLDWIDGVEL